MRKTASCRASAIGLIVFVSLIAGGIFVPAAMACVNVGDNLCLFADFRFRYEIDEEYRKLGGTKRHRERDRARIRVRYGFKYQWSDHISFGMRLRTSMDSVQSPHQTLGLLDGRGTTFGLDRGYIHFKFLDGGFLWLGKNNMNFWQQNEAFWDGDAQPEGGAIGYKLNLGTGGSVTVQSVHTWLRDNSWGGGGKSIGDDETATTIQGVFVQPLGDHTVTLAAGALFAQDDTPNSLPGEDATYFIGSAQGKTKVAGIGFKIGADYLNSDVDNDMSGVNPGHAFWIKADDQDEGYVINFAAKWKNVGFKFEHYYIELNAVPLQGAVAQDDFRFSSNFEGQKYQIGYDFGRGLNVDFRVYHQYQILDRDPPEGLAGGVVGTGSYIQDVESNTRYQVNLNIKF